MEAYRSAAEVAARKRHVLVTPVPRTNVIAVRFARPSVVNAECGSGWYHAAALNDAQPERPKA